MKIIAQLENANILFEDAVNINALIIERFKDFPELFAKIGLLHNGTSGLTNPDVFNKSDIRIGIKHSIVKYLNNSADLNSSRVGYSLFLIGISSNGFKLDIMTHLGTPQNAGYDSICINFDDGVIESNFQKSMIEIKKFIIELLLLLNPIKLVCTNNLLKKSLQLNLLNVGFIVYIKNLEKEAITQTDKMEIVNLGRGLLIAPLFTNYNETIQKLDQFYFTNDAIFEKQEYYK